MAEHDWMLWFDDMAKDHGLAMWRLLCMKVYERKCVHRLSGFSITGLCAMSDLNY